MPTTHPITTRPFEPSKEPIIIRIIAFSLLTLILMTATGVFSHFNFLKVLWLFIYTATSIYIFTDIKPIIKTIASTWLVFMLPCFALLSAFWSEDPARSLFASLQLIFTTFIAVWIATRFTPETIFKSLVLATGFGVLASILNDYLHFVTIPPPIGVSHDEIPYTGIFKQKNVYGKDIALLVLALIVIGIRYKKQFITLGICLLLSLPLWRTQSVSSILIYLITMTLPVFWILSRHIKNQITLITSIFAVILLGVFFALLLDLDPINRLLQVFSRDTTLTGRTWIWSVGWDVFSRHPFLGVGYQAFWQPGNFNEVKMIHATFHGQQINGFHNAFIEVLVALGIFGFGIFITFLLATIYHNVIWFFKKPSIISLGMLTFVLSSIVAAMFDVIMFRQHEIFYILIVSSYVIAKNILGSDSCASS